MIEWQCIVKSGSPAGRSLLQLVPPPPRPAPWRERSVNVALGPKEDRLLITGLHTVADISCTTCGSVLGWKYEYAFEESQKYVRPAARGREALGAAAGGKGAGWVGLAPAAPGTCRSGWSAGWRPACTAGWSAASPGRARCLQGLQHSRAQRPQELERQPSPTARPCGAVLALLLPQKEGKYIIEKARVLKEGNW